MKKFILLLGLLLTSLFSISAQNKKPPIEERAINADVIFEGKIIHQESFWDNQRTGIFTESTIEVSKMFKGITVNTIKLITQGGAVDDYFQTISHSIDLNVNSEGIFFCKEYNVERIKENKFLMFDGSTGFVEYFFDGQEYPAADKYFTYSNLNREVYEPITSVLRKDFTKIKQNTFEGNVGK